jgi:hypothetical protein
MTLCEPSSQHLQERVEALAPFRLGGGLRAFGKRCGDGEPKSDEQSEGLGRDREIAFQSFSLPGQQIEPAGHSGLAPVSVVRGEERHDGDFGDQRLRLVFLIGKRG